MTVEMDVNLGSGREHPPLQDRRSRKSATSHPKPPASSLWHTTFSTYSTPGRPRIWRTSPR